MKRHKTLYRIVGGRGEWFAFHYHMRVDIWMRHACRVHIPTRRNPQNGENAIQGRTPAEALYRLKQALGKVA